jgi:hypothetical protein
MSEGVREGRAVREECAGSQAQPVSVRRHVGTGMAGMLAVLYAYLAGRKRGGQIVLREEALLAENHRQTAPSEHT